MKIRISTIRARLLIGFVLMALLSAFGMAIASIVVGYVNGQEQTHNRLDSVALSKELQIVVWTDGLQNELVTLLKEEGAIGRIIPAQSAYLGVSITPSPSLSTSAEVVLARERDQKYYPYYSNAVRNRLRIFLIQSSKIKGLYLVNTDGQVVISTDATWEGTNVSKLFFFQQGLIEPVVQLPFGIGEEFIFISRPVLDADGQVLGVLAGRVEMEPLRQILAEPTGLGESGKTHLIDPNYALLSVSDLELRRSFYRRGQSDIIDAVLESQTQGFGSYTNENDVQVLGVSRWIPGLQAALLVEQDQTEVFQAVVTSLGINLGITLLVVLLAVAVSSYISKSIATPLVDLANTATQIAAGDLTRQVEVSRDDEIGVVSQAFNSMTKQLRDLFDSLEQRVADRTQALQNANRSLERQTLQLEISAHVSCEITSILEIDQLLNHVVRLIGNAFEYDYVHIFLLDVGEHQLHHRAGNMERKPSLILLPLDGKGINCEAVRENRYIQVDNVKQSTRYLPDDNMPDALSELVLPLRVGNQVIGTLDVLSSQIAAFSESDVLVLQSLGDQIAIAIENARLYRRSQELAVMEERTRLARNLHDSVTQSLYSLSLLVAGWQQGTREDKIEKVDIYLQRTAEITQRMLREMRLMIHEMRPPDLEEDGLVGALHKRLEAVENRAGVRTRLFAEGLVEIPVAMEEELYLIALEALNNSLKHAAASVITIKLASDNKHIFLNIEDDGPGFDLETALKSGGLGLTNMKERAIRLGGKLTISTQENKGTTISASLPYTNSE